MEQFSRRRRAGDEGREYYNSQSNIIEGKSLVSLYPLFWIWNTTTQQRACYGATEAGPKERKKKEHVMQNFVTDY